MLLEELTNLSGVSGNEKEVRDFIISQITPYADEVTVDRIGNVIALKKGDSSKKVMLSAHMDEVGFIISGITEKGFLNFKTVGGIDVRTVISKRVRVGKEKINGVIGIKAIHLQKRSERDSVPEFDDLYIDIGAKDKESAEKYVKIGDYACFDTRYEAFGETAIKAKAIDDRIGCGVLIEMIKNPQKYDTYFCFTTGEEIGLRGARNAAYRIMPDIAFVIEATSCSDISGLKPHEYVTRFGKGAAITFMDRCTIVDDDLRKKIHKIGEEAKIPVQYKCSINGGNDAGRIHLTGAGIKTASISLPCRYIHSANSVAAVSDIKAVENLMAEVLKRIDEVI